MKEKLLQIVINLLPFILEQITPQIKDLAFDLINELDAKAKATDNPVDDVLVDLLKTIVGMK